MRKRSDRDTALAGPSPRYRLAAGCVFLALAPLARLLEMLMLAQVRKNASLLALLLEAPESTLEGLALLYPNSGHELIAPFHRVMVPCVPDGTTHPPVTLCARTKPWDSIARPRLRQGDLRTGRKREATPPPGIDPPAGRPPPQIDGCSEREQATAHVSSTIRATSRFERTEVPSTGLAPQLRAPQQIIASTRMPAPGRGDRHPRRDPHKSVSITRIPDATSTPPACGIVRRVALTLLIP
jgi:hypothetical protein